MEDTLQQLSLYLANRIGLDANTCYYGLLALAASFVAAFLRIAFLSLRDDDPQSFDEAQPPGNTPAPVFWARWLVVRHA